MHKDQLKGKTRKERKRNWARQNMSEMCVQAKIHRLIQKAIVLQVYSDGQMCCNKCGYDKSIDALTIDHIEPVKGDKEWGTKYFYTWIINNQFPDNLQVLCMNCQFIKRVENNECARRYKYGNSQG